MKLQRPDIVAVFGASGTGKTYLIQQMIAADTRLLIWDAKAEYKGQPCDSLADLVDMVRAPRWRISYRPGFRMGKREFAIFCRIAHAAGCCRVVVDELNLVTMPSYAPPEWMHITCRGKEAGLRIIGASQRTADIDKHFIGNCTRLIVGRMPWKDDARPVSPYLGDAVREVPHLENWHFLSVEIGRRGNVTLLTP